MKVFKSEVITGSKHDLLHIQYQSTNGTPCETVYKFNDTKRHKRSFKTWCTKEKQQRLMYNIKHKWNNMFTKCKCRHRSDGQLMIEEPIV